jgi:hypothetical protein
MFNQLERLKEKREGLLLKTGGIRDAIYELIVLQTDGISGPGIERLIAQHRKALWETEKELDRVSTAIFILESGS